MKQTLIVIFFFTFSLSSFSQVSGTLEKEQRQRVGDTTSTDVLSRRGSSSTNNASLNKGVITDYKIISLERDTTYVDTTLALFKEYKYNYLRKDDFDVLPFANLGQTYNSLSRNFDNTALMPLFGARARHFNYMEVEDIKYYHVPTPLTELMYKTAFEQGQLLDAFFTINTNRQFNFSVAYKGMRSLGKYQSALTSSGNFRFTTNYKTKNDRYQFRGHVVTQDLLNEENGGIVDEEIQFFEEGIEEFKEDRSLFQVNFENAESILRGKRFFMDHHYDLISKTDSLSHNIIRIGNILSFEDKFYEYNQAQAATDFFGPSFRDTGIKERVTLEDFRAQVNATYSNNIIGDIGFNVNYANYNYGYNRIIVLDDQTIPNRIKGSTIALGGDYKKQIGKFSLKGSLGANISGDLNGNYLNAESQYQFNENNSAKFGVLINSRAPNYNYVLYQSNYQDYNWFNNFSDVNTKQFVFNFMSKKLLNVDADYTSINNYTYFTKNGTTDRPPTKPFQFDQVVNYARVKLSKDIKYGNFGLDNTVMYQKVLDGEQVLNVPELITRNTLYYNNHFFKKALFLQTGITFKYFTKYNMDAYDPLLAEFYVQNNQEFGGFPLLDFFINAKIRQTRIYLKAEHFNSHFTGYNYYAAPNNPYRDFTVRFGLVWNFFL